MKRLNVHFILGINADRVETEIYDTNGITESLIDKKEYTYGLNASYNRKNAEYAQKDYEDALKYGWALGYHSPKPFIGDLIHDIIETYYISDENITYSGYNVFAGRKLTDEEIQERRNKIADEF